MLGKTLTIADLICPMSARRIWHPHCVGRGEFWGRVTEVSMNREDTMNDWMQLIRAEYHEIPGLHLTKRQVQRLWNLDAAMCEALLVALEDARVLRRTRSGAYVGADA